MAKHNIRSILDLALSKPRLVLKFESRAKATSFRQKAHSARAEDRKEAESMYSPSDERHGTSPYDRLVLRVVEHNVVIDHARKANVDGLVGVYDDKGEEVEI